MPEPVDVGPSLETVNVYLMIFLLSSWFLYLAFSVYLAWMDINELRVIDARLVGDWKYDQEERFERTP